MDRLLISRLKVNHNISAKLHSPAGTIFSSSPQFTRSARVCNLNVIPTITPLQSR